MAATAAATGGDPAGGAEAGGHVQPQQRGAWTAFLKAVMTAPGDLASLSCPAFLLSGNSVLELEAAYMSHPDLFFDIGRTDDAAERTLRAARWWIQSLWSNFGAPFVASQSVKKPYNPILGEQFRCTWEDAGTDWKTVTMVAEQVSHHPPVSAFYLENEPLNMHLNGSILTKTKFRGTTVKVDNIGQVKIYVGQHNETITITYPEMQLRGLIGGQIFVEIIGETEVRSSTGYVARIDHIPKPWFSGEYHHLRGGVWRAEDGPKQPVYTFAGRWTERTWATHVPSGRRLPLSDVSVPMATPRVPPLEELADNESPKVWRGVTEALLQQDYAAATQAKTAIEERQRQHRRERDAAGQEWQPKHFRRRETAPHAWVHERFPGSDA